MPPEIPHQDATPQSLASTLVQDLMLVSVLVAGQGAQHLADALEQAGAAAETHTNGQPAEGFDLAILLTEPNAAQTPETRALVETLSRASDRLLLAPLPLGQTTATASPALPELPQWFELFANLGYQPVVEFDASFVSPGAFLVDRAATAAEADLAAFTDRLQLGPEAATQQRQAVQDAERSVRSDLLAARTQLAALEQTLQTTQTSLAAARATAATLTQQNQAAQAAAQAAAQDAEARNAGWDALRTWTRADATAPWRNTPAALARDLPRLNTLRAPNLPPIPPAPKRRLWPTRHHPTRTILQTAALIRASPHFDPAWYIASHPTDFETPLDPAFHYVLVGARRGADPGPYFDTAAYLQAHPDAASCPLAHAIKQQSK